MALKLRGWFDGKEVEEVAESADRWLVQQAAELVYSCCGVEVVCAQDPLAVNFVDGPQLDAADAGGQDPDADHAEDELTPAIETQSGDGSDSTPQHDKALGPGAVTWEGSFVLCLYLESVCELESLKGLRILELGAGTGVPGIMLAGLGSHCVLTDLLEVVAGVTVPNINLNANLWRAQEEGKKKGSCSALPLMWGNLEEENVVKTEGPFDLIICADCCYFGEVVSSSHPADPTALVASLERQAFPAAAIEKGARVGDSLTPLEGGNTGESGGGGAAAAAEGVVVNDAEANRLKTLSPCIVLVSMEVRTAKAFNAFVASASERFPIVKELSLEVIESASGEEANEQVMPLGFRNHHKFYLLCGGELALARWDGMVKPRYRRSRKEKKVDSKRASLATHSKKKSSSHKSAELEAAAAKQAQEAAK
jgi:predicted nicotinamide N-methyase